VERSGLGDATLRMGLNLLGGPAMTPKQFGSYRPRTLLGTSLTVKTPTGQTTVDGVTNDDHQSNSRVGLTVSTRFGRHHSVRLAISKGAITRIGGDFNSYGLSCGYSWTKGR